MFIGFFQTLRAAGLPVSVREFLLLLQGLQVGLAGPASADAWGMEDFYFLARAALVKDEKHFDRFDRAFDAHFGALGDGRAVADAVAQGQGIPADWLQADFMRQLSDEEKAALQALDWHELLATLAKRLQEQKARHAGGNKWIGTGGTSPFGHAGHNPRGVRIGGKGGGQSAVKVWERRIWRDYDDSEPLGTRQIKLALRRLRRFARQGGMQELDLDGTVRHTAANAGWLDIRTRAERRNNIRLLLLMDVGGTMDAHVARVQELFSAVKAEFKQLEFYYFHNCVYDHVWKNNRRRFAEKTPTRDLLRKYGRDYRLVFVGDATMSPYEILQPGGSVEYDNEEAGEKWLQRLVQAFPKFVWINPEPQEIWPYRQSIAIVQKAMAQRMFPLTLNGLDAAMRLLSK